MRPPAQVRDVLGCIHCAPASIRHVIDELMVRADGLATALMEARQRRRIELAKKLDLAALFIERTDEGA